MFSNCKRLEAACLAEHWLAPINGSVNFLPPLLRDKCLLSGRYGRL